MKKILILFILLFSIIVHSQNGKVYKYYVHLNDYHNAQLLSKGNDGLMTYSGSNSFESTFFNNYQILEYVQAFEIAIDVNVLNIFYVETYNPNFIDDLLETFPSIYKSYTDISDLVYETLNYYPNDYGTSSPNPNLGFNYFNKAYDYVNTPKAWNITTGLSKVRIGISDTYIHYNNPDLINKVTPIDGYTQQLYSNSHGTGVAAIAAARGNNSYGSVGVCMDCSIVEASMFIGYPTVFSNLYKMYQKGARVINMSWTNSGHINQVDTWIPEEQMVINDLTNNFGVTLVAAAGNVPSFQTPASNFNCSPPYGILYVYPASYDNVISVSSIRHNNVINLPLSTSDISYCCTSPLFPVYIDLEDSISYSANGANPLNPIGVLRNGFYQNQCNPDGFQYNFTLNEKVDIMAPGYQMYFEPKAVNTPSNPLESGTSISAPMVSGTIGLMLSVNDCLIPREIEAILKLSTKDIENMPLNQNYMGYVGAGKLEVGDTVEFVDEMKKNTGNAIINNHIFNRFNFTLERINNKLSIENVTFKELNVSDFTAKNSINVVTSDFKPNSNGFVDLKIDSDITVCTVSQRLSEKNQNESKSEMVSKVIKLYPNPNKGTFTISLNKSISEIEITVFDTFGKLIYQTNKSGKDLELSIPNLPSGLYIVKLNSNEITETLKFLKQ
jgi:Subtilase family/Secretion system C-terminal sorting domain